LTLAPSCKNLVACFNLKLKSWSSVLGPSLISFFGFNFFLFLFLFVKVFFIIHYFTNRRIGFGRNLHQIKFKFICFGLCLTQLKNPGFNVITYQPNNGCGNTPVNSVRVFLFYIPGASSSSSKFSYFFILLIIG